MRKVIICLILLLLCSCAPPLTEKWFGELEKVNNPEAVDVTYAELVVFLEQDQTDKNKWVLGEYVCVHFATDLHNNAEAAGIRCAIVHTPDYAHALNAFMTTDDGLVFVDNSVHTDLPFKCVRPDPKTFHYYW